MQAFSFGSPRAALVLLVLLSGCLPRSCHRIESQALLSADSLSRALAETIQPDTLTRIWATTDRRLSYPRSIQWSPDGRVLYVADSKSGEVVRLDTSGQIVGTVNLPATSHPYLAGWRGDTLYVLDPDAHRVHLLRDNAAIGEIVLEGGELLQRAYVYATPAESGIAVKAVRKDRGAVLAQFDGTGNVRETLELAGPYWRHAGFLRTWGDSLISLCGYRPVLDVVTSGGASDSLLLQGFDSPMLSRSRLFVRGDVDEPPLLYSSAAPLGDALFVLNLRPGWIRIDVYDREGVLRDVLVEQGTMDYGYYPVDLAVQEGADGDHLIAVAVAGNNPRVELYRWVGRN